MRSEWSLVVDQAIQAMVQRQPERLRALAAGDIPGAPESVLRIRHALEALALTLTNPAAAMGPAQAALAEDPPSVDLQLFLLRSLYPADLAMHGDTALLERFRQLADGAHHPRARAIGHRLAWEHAYWHHRPGVAHASARAALADAGDDLDLAIEYRARAFFGALQDYDLAAAAVHRAELDPHVQRMAGWGLFIRHGFDDMDLLLGQGPALLQRVEHLRAAGDPGWAWAVLPWPAIHVALLAGRVDLATELVERLTGVERRVGGLSPVMVAVFAHLGRLLLHIFHRRYAEARALLPEAGQMTRDWPEIHRIVQNLALRLAWIDRDGQRMRAGLRLLDPREEAGDCAIFWVLLDLCEGRPRQARNRIVRLRRQQPPTVLKLHIDSLFELTAGQMWELFEAGREPEPSGPPERVRAEIGEPALIGDDPAVRTVHERIARYAPHDQPVLLTGETGTGKEIAARLLHRSGPRSAGPFLALNCASLMDSLAEAELFGHARGAFTGAAGDRPGLLAAAADGTLFLDEVNSLPPRLQGLLMRVLETGDYRPVGDTRSQRSTARIIAASNEDLASVVEAGRFRADLYYRLSRLRIDLPPLRARRDDILGLTRHLLDLIAPGAAITVAGDLEAALLSHPWPGNVRELRNVLERGVILARRRDLLTLADCPELAAAPDPEPEPVVLTPRPPTAIAGAPIIPGNARIRERRRRLLGLFEAHPHLYAVDAVRVLGCVPRTCAADLRALAAAGLIRRVVTSANLGTSYWIRC